MTEKRVLIGRASIGVVLVALSAALFAGCGQRAQEVVDSAYVAPKVAMRNFEAIQTGMTLDRVASIMGSPGTLEVSSDVGGVKTEQFRWVAEANTGANMSVMFQGGFVVMKSQFGLQ
jgi:hypothetical protein